MQHHLRTDLFKGGVYDPREAIETFCTEKSDIWSRWKAGQSLHAIGRAFDKPHGCIRSVYESAESERSHLVFPHLVFPLSLPL